MAELGEEVYSTFKQGSFKREDILKKVESLFEKQPLFDKTEIIKTLATFPTKLLPYFFVEIKLQNKEKGCMGYEKRELGCLKAAFNGMASAFKNIKDPFISKKLITDIHQECANFSEMIKESYKIGMFREHDDHEAFEIKKELCSLAGTTELIDFLEKNPRAYIGNSEKIKEIEELTDEYWKLTERLESMSQNIRSLRRKKLDIEIDENISSAEKQKRIDKIDEKIEAKKLDYDAAKKERKNLSKHILSLQNQHYINKEYIKNLSIDKSQFAQELFDRVSKDGATYIAPKTGTSEGFQHLMQDMIDSYNGAVLDLQDKSVDERLEFIVSHIKQLELIHPFHDANGRTFANCLMSRMLVQNGFFPPIYFDPNIFDAFSVKEIVSMLKLAIANTLIIVDCMKKNSNDLFDFNTSHLSQGDIDALKDMTDEFRKTLDPHYDRNNMHDFQDTVHNRLRAMYIATETIADIKNKWRPPTGKLFSGGFFSGDQLAADLENLPQPVEPAAIAATIINHLETNKDELRTLNPRQPIYKSKDQFISKLQGILDQFTQENLITTKQLENITERYRP